MAQTIIVDTTPGFRMPTIFYSQGDIGRTFSIDLRSRFGDSLPASPTITIQATKPSGLGFSVAATSISNSVATFTVTDTMTNEAGRFPAEIKVVKNSVTLYTANFYIECEASAHPEGTTDGDLDSILPKFMSVTVTTLSPGSSATYTYDPATNTATFGIPKGDTGDDGTLSSNVIAATYDATATYDVGDFSFYNGSLYRCTTAITTAEAWTAGHWSVVNVTDELTDVKADISDIEDAIDYVSPYLVENSEFVNGLWANGNWRTDGNYGKYKSNRVGFELESFKVKVTTATFTNLVISITCFDESNASLGTFIANNTVIQSGNYSVTKTGILNSKPTAKYISVGIGKKSGDTYYDLPSDIEITVEKTTAPQTIADRVSALEAVIGSGTSVIVAQNGGGDYTTIEDAVNGITDDSASKPYTILIKNGVYDEHIHVGGGRYLSFIGENREDCIIRSHTGMYTDAPLWIDGNFTIENLTLQMLDDEAPGTWTPGLSQNDAATMMPGYALHIDGGATTSVDSVYGYKLGVVRNCTLYSVAFPALGAGLHSNQKLIFDNCTIVRNTSAKYQTSQYQYYTNYNGAFLIHDSTHANDSVNQNLEVKDCLIVCNLGKSATFRFKYGTPSNVKYAMIDNTFWCEATATSVVDAELNDSVLLGYSHGNNVNDFNA